MPNMSTNTKKTEVAPPTWYPFTKWDDDNESVWFVPLDLRADYAALEPPGFTDQAKWGTSRHTRTVPVPALGPLPAGLERRHIAGGTNDTTVLGKELDGDTIPPAGCTTEAFISRDEAGFRIHWHLQCVIWARSVKTGRDLEERIYRESHTSCAVCGRMIDVQFADSWIALPYDSAGDPAARLTACNYPCGPLLTLAAIDRARSVKASNGKTLEQNAAAALGNHQTWEQQRGILRVGHQGTALNLP